MEDASLLNLITLTAQVEDLIYRADIQQNTIEEFLQKHEVVHNFVLVNQTYYQTTKEHTEAICLSSYIMICLLTRINELNERGSY